MRTADGTAKPTAGESFIIAALLFVATIYAPFAIAAVMPTAAPSSAPESFRLSVILVALSMGVGTAISTYVTSMSLVLAPAVGLTAFFSQGTNLLTVAQLYWSGFAAGLIIILCNIKILALANESVRYHVLKELPRPIKAGVAGGIGALLAESAIRMIQTATDDLKLPSIILLPVICCVAIFLSDTYAERLERAHLSAETARRTGSGNDEVPPLSPRYYIAKLAYALIPVAAFIVMAAFVSEGASQTAALKRIGIRPIFLSRLSHLLHPEVHKADPICMLVFALVISFVILTDIVGTPFQMLDPSRRLILTDPNLQEIAAGQRAVRNSFFADAFMIFLNSAMSIPPSVYYAENHVLSNYHFERFAFSKNAGWIYSLSLFFVAGLMLTFDLPLARFSEISSLAAAPVLLVIGVQIVGASIRAEKTSETRAESEPGERSRLSENGPLAYLVTGMIIILTPWLGLEWSLPAGIATYFVQNWVLGNEMGLTTQLTGWFALGVVLLMAWVKYGPK